MELTITSLMAAAEAGTVSAAGPLDAASSSGLRRLARRALVFGSDDTTLDAPAFLKTAYREMADREGARFPDCGRVLARAARAMRGLVLDVARARRARHLAGRSALTMTGATLSEEMADYAELAQIGEAIDELACVDPALALVVDLRFFCGLSFAEIAAMRGEPERVVRRLWEKARIYLYGIVTDASSS